MPAIVKRPLVTKRFGGKCHRLKDIEASQRAAAKALGVNQSTVARDLDDANASPAVEEMAEIQGPAEPVDANASPEWFQAESSPAELSKKQAKKDAKRQAAVRNNEATRQGALGNDTGCSPPL